MFPLYFLIDMDQKYYRADIPLLLFHYSYHQIATYSDMEAKAISMIGSENDNRIFFQIHIFKALNKLDQSLLL